MSLPTIGAICAALLFTLRFAQMVTTGRRFKVHRYMIFPDTTIWRALIPSWTDIPWVVYGNNHPFKVKHSEFLRSGRDAYIEVSLTHPSRLTTFIADPQAIKEVTRPRAPFPLDVEVAKPFLGMFGPNITTTEGDTWRMHRRIITQAFTDKNLQLVWSETEVVLDKLFEQWGEQQRRDVYIPHVPKMTKDIGLAVFSAAALGRRMTWGRESTDSKLPGYVHSFQRTLSIVSGGVIDRMMLPSWAEGWTVAARNLASGFREFKEYLLVMTDLYKRQGKVDQDLFGYEDSSMAGSESLLMNILVSANEDNKEDGGTEFTQGDVLGNTFLLLFAGHETTSNAIAFGLGFLAVYPEIQDRVYAQVKQVTGSRTKLEYADMSELKLVTGVMLEALRMYPALLQLSRNVDEDFTISVASNTPGSDENTREPMVIPANSKIVMSLVAVHYNPRYWPEPEEFNPERFCQPYNKDAFLGFATGRRACVGRRFAETEGTAVLTGILAKYKVSIDYSKFPAIPGESAQARRQRLLKPCHVLSVAPERLPLVFKRR